MAAGVDVKAIAAKFTTSEQKLLRNLPRLYGRVSRAKANAALDGWLGMLPALQRLSATAMRHARVNRRHGRGYNQTFGALLDFYTPGIDRGYVKALLWLSEQGHAELLAKLRAEMAPGRRSRLNSPVSAEQVVRRHLATGPRPRRARVDSSLLQAQLATAKERIAQLEQELAEAGGVLSRWPVAATELDGVARILYENKQMHAVKLAQLILKRHQDLTDLKKGR